MIISPSHTIAFCVDMQERLFPHIHEHDELVKKCTILIRGLRIIGVPIVVTEQYVKGLGSTIESIATALGDYEPIEKSTFSCCGNDQVEANVLGTAVYTAILFGIETHVCILQTGLDLLAQGRTVLIVEDCVSSRRLNDKTVAIQRLQQSGALITTVESLLFELLRTSQSKHFQEVLALVK